MRYLEPSWAKFIFSVWPFPKFPSLLINLHIGFKSNFLKQLFIFRKQFFVLRKQLSTAKQANKLPFLIANNGVISHSAPRPLSFSLYEVRRPHPCCLCLCFSLLQQKCFGERLNDGVDCRTFFHPRHSPFDLFQDAFDPFLPMRSVIQASKLMDEFMTGPILAAAQGMGSASRRGWEMKENKDSMFLRMDMPGLGKEDVKVLVEQDTLVINGSKESSSEEEESGRRYSGGIELSPKLFKLGEIKAEMKNGVLNVVVPKATEEERKNAVEVNVD